MTKSDNPPSEKRPEPAAKKTGRKAKDSKDLTREEKLAEALRANLKRRKEAARTKKD